MPKNTSKDTTNVKDVVSLTVNDALGRGVERGQKLGPEKDAERARRATVKADTQLTPEEQVLVRTEPSAATAADSHYRHHYNIGLDRGVDPDKVDWTDDVYASMHEANKVATLQFAMNAGLHPQGDATFEGAVSSGQSRTAKLVYSVEVVPASLADDASQTRTPRKALVEMPGASTFPDDDGLIKDSPPAT